MVFHIDGIYQENPVITPEPEMTTRRLESSPRNIAANAARMKWVRRLRCHPLRSVGGQGAEKSKDRIICR
jgi:hypothetical protein